jgi:nicotinamidase-related amidase
VAPRGAEPARRASSSGPEPIGGRVARTALVVVDLQNDFCSNPAASRHRGGLATLEAVASNTVRAVEAARAHGTEVVFVRYVGDAVRGRPGRRPRCLEGSWGAEFHRVSPAPGEPVFTKRACFDAFLGEGFEEHLVARGIGHLVFAGVYTDVCVDSTARTAFQKGYEVTVLTDCTTSLLLPDTEILRFMTVVYGARTTTHDLLFAAGEDRWSAPGTGSRACRTASA